jgi:hypothetical protein
MDATFGLHPKLPTNGSGLALQGYITKERGVLIEDTRKNALWHVHALALGKRWASYESAKGGDYSLVHLEDRHRRRAYDALVFWDLLILNLSEAKQATLLAQLKQEKQQAELAEK